MIRDCLSKVRDDESRGESYVLTSSALPTRIHTVLTSNFLVRDFLILDPFTLHQLRAGMTDNLYYLSYKPTDLIPGKHLSSVTI